MIPDYPLGQTLDFKFTTRAFATGIPTVLAGSPVVEIYEDDSDTQITDAETLTLDFDGKVGFNNLHIVATAANGFESGKSYCAVISTGTVGGVSVVGEVVQQFSIERSAGALAMKYMGPRGPGIYLNDAAANTNTVFGTDGTIDNPVSTIAAAKTLADGKSIHRIYMVNNSVITLAATMEGYEFIGIGEMTSNTIDLGSQDVDNSYFENVLISGAQGGTERFEACRCVLGTLTSLEVTTDFCRLMGPFTVRNDCSFDHCSSTVAGAGTPVLDINSIANINIYCGHYTGGLQVNNAVATTVMSYQSDGQIIIDSTCTGLEIVVRGDCKVTDNGTSTDLTQADIAAIKAITDAIGSVAAAKLARTLGAASPDGTVDTVINSHTPTTTEFQADNITEETANHFHDRVILFVGGALMGQVTQVQAYVIVGGIGQFTVSPPLTEPPANDDPFDML